MQISKSELLSIASFDVDEGQEAAFLGAAAALHDMMRRQGYARDQLVRDLQTPRRFHNVRVWSSMFSRERADADADVQTASARLDAIARRATTVGGATKAHAPLSDDPAVLIVEARRAREYASADFSTFKVGAALETDEGEIVTGCNVENASYGLTICAERVAMFKALSEGRRAFRRIAVVADTEAPTPPCGPCRQILWEFGGDLEVIIANLTRQTGSHRMRDLLPLPFDARLLGR